MALFPKKSITLVVLGLDGAGKSTLLYRLQSNFSAAPKAGWGFSTATIRFKLIWMWACIPVPVFRWITFYDVAGGPKIRGIWPKYLAEAHGCIFVIDAADQARIREAVDALHDIYSNESLKGKPLLILANKSDIPTAISEKYVPAHLHIEDLFHDGDRGQKQKRTDKYFIKSISLGYGYRIEDIKSAYTGAAVKDAIRWIIEAVEDNRDELDARIRVDLEKEAIASGKQKSIKPKWGLFSRGRDHGTVHPASDE